jgi:hypothetical protein
MRKIVIALIALVSLGLVASQVWACRWAGYWGGPMRGPWGGYYSNIHSGRSYQKFLNDTAELRQELAAKQGKYNALMAQPTPDPEKAGQLSQEIASLHDQLQAKAESFGLPALGPHNAPRGFYGYCPGHAGWGYW